MRWLNALAIIPVFAVALCGVALAADENSFAEDGSLLPYIAGGILFFFLLSALILIIRETRIEAREKRRREKG